MLLLVLLPSCHPFLACAKREKTIFLLFRRISMYLPRTRTHSKINGLMPNTQIITQRLIRIKVNKKKEIYGAIRRTRQNHWRGTHEIYSAAWNDEDKNCRTEKESVVVRKCAREFLREIGEGGSQVISSTYKPATGGDGWKGDRRRKVYNKKGAGRWGE